MIIESINQIAPSVIVAACVFVVLLIFYRLVLQIDRLESDKAQLESEKAALNNALVDMQITYGMHAHEPVVWYGACEYEEKAEEN